eukprot:gene1754-biopygen4847
MAGVGPTMDRTRAAQRPIHGFRRGGDPLHAEHGFDLRRVRHPPAAERLREWHPRPRGTPPCVLGTLGAWPEKPSAARPLGPREPGSNPSGSGGAPDPPPRWGRPESGCGSP